jgi:hypothetical protein
VQTDGGNAAATPTGLAKILSDDLPILRLAH